MAWDDHGPKKPMGDHVVPFGNDHVIFVSERAGKAANKIE
jgi:hypothetical protein